MNARSSAAPTGSRRRVLCLFGFAALLAVTGCQEKLGKLHPVEGNVTVAGSPLTSGIVTFYPDPPKPGATPINPVGNIEPDGSYKLKTQGKLGAPAGKYKVTVTIPAQATQGGSTGSDLAAPPVDEQAPPRLFSQSFESPLQTPLQIEVVASPSPGQYDLQLTQ